MRPGPRALAIAAGEKWYWTGKPCKHGHIAMRQVSSKGCSECHRIAFARWEAKNLSKRAAEKRKARAANPDHAAEISKRSRLKHPDANRARTKARYRAKRHEYLSASKAHKALKMQRCPAWADRSKIAEIYRVAIETSERTGIKHHVDHFYPLRGRTVCGLHVPENLRVIPASENMSKYNKCPK